MNKHDVLSLARRLMFAILHRHQSRRRCPTRSQRIIIEIELVRLSTPLNLEASRLGLSKRWKTKETKGGVRTK